MDVSRARAPPFVPSKPFLLPKNGDSTDFRPKASLPKTKLVIRFLPPKMTEEQFLSQFGKFINKEMCLYYYFVPGRVPVKEDKLVIYSRAYAAFKSQDLLRIFFREFKANLVFQFKENIVVEYAPSQARIFPPEPTPLQGTFQNDPVYQSFIARLTDDSIPQVPLVVKPPITIEKKIKEKKRSKKISKGKKKNSKDEGTISKKSKRDKRLKKDSTSNKKSLHNSKSTVEDEKSSKAVVKKRERKRKKKIDSNSTERKNEGDNITSDLAVNKGVATSEELVTHKRRKPKPKKVDNERNFGSDKFTEKQSSEKQSSEKQTSEKQSTKKQSVEKQNARKQDTGKQSTGKHNSDKQNTVKKLNPDFSSNSEISDSKKRSYRQKKSKTRNTTEEKSQTKNTNEQKSQSTKFAKPESA